MTTEYTQVETELLAQMVRVAKQNPGTPAEQLEALQKAVEGRKKQLLAQRAELANQPCNSDEAIRQNNEAQLAIYQQLITLEPDHYPYYDWAGFYARLIPDYPASAAYYSQALQLVGDDIDKLARLYEERSRTYCRYKDYGNALADSKLYVRFKYLSEKGKNLRGRRYYNFYMICEALRHLGHKAVGDAIETTYELAELSDEGVTDELIEDYLHLLDIPFEPHKTRTRPPLSYFNELKQEIPTDPQDIKEWQLRKQLYEEIETKPTPDFALLMRVSQELVTLDPAYYRYHATAGEMCFRARKYAEAIPHFINALKLVDHAAGDAYWQRRTRREHLFTLHRLVAYAYKQERNHQNATTHYEQAIRADPRHPETTNLLAMIIHCTYRMSFAYQFYRDKAHSMEEYFDKVFPTHNVPWYVSQEKEWVEVLVRLSTQFLHLNRLGIVRSRRQPAGPQTEAVDDRPVTSPEKSEQERQQEQKAAETIKHLEALLQLVRIW